MSVHIEGSKRDVIVVRKHNKGYFDKFHKYDASVKMDESNVQG
jgi:hypothetical protein